MDRRIRGHMNEKDPSHRFVSSDLQALSYDPIKVEDLIPIGRQTNEITLTGLRDIRSSIRDQGIRRKAIET